MRTDAFYIVFLVLLISRVQDGGHMKERRLTRLGNESIARKVPLRLFFRFDNLGNKFLL